MHHLTQQQVTWHLMMQYDDTAGYTQMGMCEASCVCEASDLAQLVSFKAWSSWQHKMPATSSYCPMSMFVMCKAVWPLREYTTWGWLVNNAVWVLSFLHRINLLHQLHTHTQGERKTKTEFKLTVHWQWLDRHKQALISPECPHFCFVLFTGWQLLAIHSLASLNQFLTSKLINMVTSVLSNKGFLKFLTHPSEP